MHVYVGSELRYDSLLCQVNYLGKVNYTDHRPMRIVYDLPTSLSEPLRLHLSLSESQYAYLISLLFTIYSAPNTILPFFSGILTQLFGERQIWCATGACIVVGQLLFAFGVQVQQIWLIILGRVIIGLGGEIIGVLGYNVVTRWYSYSSAFVDRLSRRSYKLTYTIETRDFHWRWL